MVANAYNPVKTLLEGSWVGTGRVLSMVALHITLFRALITLLNSYPKP